MNLLDAYYKLCKMPEAKSKLRFDECYSTCNYEPLERLRNAKKELFLYYGKVPNNFKAQARRKADMAITKSTNISSVYVPDINLPYAYGDINGTTDAILLIFNKDLTEIEILVAKGQKHNQLSLYHLLVDGELDAEINKLRKNAEA